MSYAQVFESASIEALLDFLVDREIRELTYQPLQFLVEKMRQEFGFKILTHEYDSSLYYFSLVRNCVLHNGGKADAKLAKLKESIEVGQRIPIDEDAVSSAIISFRKFSYNVDKLFETLEANIGDQT